MPKVSIIIPFNNVEDYIEECLNSVVNQTLSDIEIILINDASTDNSEKIANSFAEQDSRIKILNIPERKGQGYARNRAIEIASGDYIGFVDSDDFIEKDMFELLYNAAVLNNTDIEICLAQEYDDINKKFKTSDYYSLAVLSQFENNVFSAEDTKDQILDINVVLWNKIYKREYLNLIGEKFPEGFIYEDLPFFFGTYLPAKRIQIVWKNLYSYRVNRRNSTMQQNNKKILDRLPMVSLTYDKLKQTAFLSDMKKKIQGWIINDLFHRYVLLSENYHKEFFFLMKKVFENLEIENIYDRYWRKVYHFEGYLLVMNNTFEDFNQKVFYKYLDLHKIEDRLRSELVNINEIDQRFDKLYSDLDKSYKYSEELFQRVDDTNEKKIKDLWGEIGSLNQIIEGYQDKIAGLNQLLNEHKERLEVEIRNLSSRDENLKNMMTKEETETKLSEFVQKLEQNKNDIREELLNGINENYKSLYKDIKDLSFVVHDNFVELNKEQYGVRNSNESFKQAIMTSQNKMEEKIDNINKEYKLYVNNKAEENNREIEVIKNVLQETKNEVQSGEDKNADLINSVKEEFIKLLQEQETKHQEEITCLENQIKNLETTLREEMKSPLKKFVERYKNKSEI